MFPCAPGVSLSIFLFLVFLNCNLSPGAPLPALLLRVIAGRINEPCASCDYDVVDVLVVELE